MTRNIATGLYTLLLSTGMYVAVSRREVPNIRAMLKARDIAEIESREELEALLNAEENIGEENAPD